MAYDVIPNSGSGFQRRVPLVPSGVMGMLMFVGIETMLFIGLISAFIVAKSSEMAGWPPPGQPRLPVSETAFNTAVLLTSGVALFFANRAFLKNDMRQAKRALLAALALGIFFVAIQGSEWVGLIRQGMTIQSGKLGGYFYLLVGTHALHALAAILTLLWTFLRMRADTLTAQAFWPAQIFWYFVVGVWPILYWLVYL